ncbi:MAG: outer membrane beta-barrel protein [Bacteroidia bacterium]|nr:outer membrane beta-barrel protein [Bacteroidia bacterium]
MKNYLIGFCLLTLAAGMSAQTKNNKFGLALGAGSQNYCGDLGSAFKIKNESYYGVVNGNAAYYLSKSFDAGLFGSIGDYGFCQPDAANNKAATDADLCPGCPGRVGLGNLNSRMLAGGIFVRYKFSNGYLLSEHSRLSPYISFGGAANSISDRMRMNCVKAGTYYSFNVGAGLKYKLSERVNLNYNFSLGYFTSDKLDFISHHSNDMYMQNTIGLGIDLF